MAAEAEEHEIIEEAAAEVQTSGLKKKLIIGIGALLLAGAGLFAGLTFLGEDEATEDEALLQESGAPKGPVLYTSLHPPLIVNFKDSLGDSHFMQITMEVMARDQNVINAIREHTPVVRNALILLYSGAVYDEVTTRDGKKQMLADGLSEIQQVMTEQIGEPGVEAVYFTALVIQ